MLPLHHSFTVFLTPACLLPPPFPPHTQAARALGPIEPSPNLNLALLGVVNTLVEDGPNKIFIGGLPTYLNEEQVGGSGRAWARVRAHAGYMSAVLKVWTSHRTPCMLIPTKLEWHIA